MYAGVAPLVDAGNSGHFSLVPPKHGSKTDNSRHRPDQLTTKIRTPSHFPNRKLFSCQCGK